MKKDAAPHEDDLLRIKSDGAPNRKKVIFICVDSLMSASIDKGIREKKLPTFRYLAEHGQYYKDLVTSFPTMSVSIDSTLLTGKYPIDHHVPSLVWYSAEDQRVVNYGTGVLEISRNGIDRFLEDAQLLNGRHLNPETPTLFEDLARKGLTSGSVNGLIYRGSSRHRLSFPLWMRAPAGLPKEMEVRGPDLLAYGAFSNPLKGYVKLPDRPTDAFGFNNGYSLNTVKYLVEQNKLPDFLYVYFSDLDQKLHKKGPSELEGVIRTDEQLGDLLQTFGSKEEALRKAVFVISGDNGMTPVLPADRHPVIDLNELLKGYHVLRTGSDVTKQTEIVLAVNDRMAYIYKLQPQLSFEQLAARLRTDPRIDILAWRQDGWIRVMRAGSSSSFAYRPKGRLMDPYRQSWTLADDPKLLDLRVDPKRHSLDYGQYPDVLQRLYSALYSHKGEFIVITADPGYEFKYDSSPTHKGGGAHGGISEAESLVPLFIAGTDRQPESLRMVDLKPYLMKLLTSGPSQ